MIALTADDQATLLRWARAAIVAGKPVAGQGELTPGLRAPAAAFVTLMQAGELRGCIGHLRHDRPVWENVVRAAVAAAREDPRFPPVTPDEVPELTVSISVLEPPVDLPDVSEFNAQRHGIIVQLGIHHALLLPKVAQELGWDEEQVLAAVCHKAGLAADAWRDPAARLQVFEAIDFGESR